MLYSLPYNIGNTLHVPGSSQRAVYVNETAKLNELLVADNELTSVFEDMTELCKMFCPDDLQRETACLKKLMQAKEALLGTAANDGQKAEVLTRENGGGDSPCSSLVRFFGILRVANRSEPPDDLPALRSSFTLLSS